MTENLMKDIKTNQQAYVRSIMSPRLNESAQYLTDLEKIYKLLTTNYCYKIILFIMFWREIEADSRNKFG